MSDYQDYLKTDHWLRLAEETKRLAGYRCQVCYSPHNLNAHHRTYERKGDELQSDLTCLCQNCHALFHSYQQTTHVETEKKNDPNAYHGVIIIWDEDNDDRIYKAIDIAKRAAKKTPLCAAGEHEGHLSLYWANPRHLQAGESAIGDMLSLPGDTWSVSHYIYERSVL